MKLSLFYELALPRPWEPDDEARLVGECLDQIESADQLGFHAIWATEHHFLEEYAHSSAPEVLLAAASQRTSRVRLGHGIMNTLPGVNHPLRVAERIATLDLVSGGRVDFGSGEGSSEAELGGFRIDPGRKRDMWREGLSVAVSALADTPFPGIDGEFVQAPPRNVVPKPVQRPHPPLWMACTRRATIRVAAEAGLGALCFIFAEPEACAEWVDEYYSVLAESGVPIGRTVNARFAVATMMMCAPTTELAVARGLEGMLSFHHGSRHYFRAGQHAPGTTSLWDAFVSERAAADGEQSDAQIAEAMGGIGTPDQIAAWLRRYEEAGVDEVLFIVQHGRTRHEDIMESIQLVGEQVLPELHARDVAAEPRREQRVRPIADAAQARAPAAPAPPAGYTFGAIPRSWSDGRPVSGMADALAEMEQANQGGHEPRPSEVLYDPEDRTGRETAR